MNHVFIVIARRKYHEDLHYREFSAAKEACDYAASLPFGEGRLEYFDISVYRRAPERLEWVDSIGSGG